MELDELKQAWSQYDRKLVENLKINKELLSKMNLDRAKSASDVPKNYELLTVVIGFGFLLYVLSATIKYSSEIKFLIPGILTSVWTIIMLTMTIGKLKLFSNFDIYNLPILDLQKQLGKIKKKHLDYKRFELNSIPLFALVAAPILGKAMRGFDLYSSPIRFIIAIGLALIIGYPMEFWIYKNLYDKKLKDTNKFLNELYKFESEE